MSLIIELFRDCNVLLLDHEGVIIRPLTHAKYASRSLKKGVAYTPPPEAIDPRGLSLESLDEILVGSDHALIRTLASRVNLGRIYGSALCSIARIDEDSGSNSLTEEQKSSLGIALSKMLGNLDEGEGGNIWLSDPESKDAWNAAQNESARDSAAAGFIEFSPIVLP